MRPSAGQLVFFMASVVTAMKAYKGKLSLENAVLIVSLASKVLRHVNQSDELPNVVSQTAKAVKEAKEEACLIVQVAGLFKI